MADEGCIDAVHLPNEFTSRLPAVIFQRCLQAIMIYLEWNEMHPPETQGGWNKPSSSISLSYKLLRLF